MVLSRKVIEQGMFVKHCKVEVYLLELKLCHNRDLDHVITEHFSKADTIGECLSYSSARRTLSVSVCHTVQQGGHYR